MNNSQSSKGSWKIVMNGNGDLKFAYVMVEKPKQVRFRDEVVGKTIADIRFIPNREDQALLEIEIESDSDSDYYDDFE